MKKLIIFVLLFSLISAPVFCQIPIKKFTENVIEFDSEYDSLMAGENYFMALNRYYAVADIDNDGKQDIILQAYAKNSDYSVNVFYNRSTDSIIRFKNNKLSGFLLRGNAVNIEVGDINNDNRLDILAPTQNFHGDEASKPLDYYPKGVWDSPGRVFVQQDSTFKEYVQPDTLNKISGNFLDTDGDGYDEFISGTGAFYRYNDTTPNMSNLLYKYSISGDSLSREFMVKIPIDEKFTYMSYMGRLSKESGDSFYIPMTKFLLKPEYWLIYPQTNYILKFRKGQESYSATDNCDTIAIIPVNWYSHNGVEYFYDLINEYGMYVWDIDKDGIEETIVEEFSMYANLSGEWEWMPGDPIRSRLKIYNNKGEDLTDKFIPHEFQSDPQNYNSTDGFAFQDINGDGLKDILPYNSWGWADYGGIEERLRKYILLNTGTSFQPFTVDIGDNYSIINKIEGDNYPIHLHGESEMGIFIIQEWVNANVLELDYSQFKFPCSENLPEITLSGKTSLCGEEDSTQLIVESKPGYDLTWLENDSVLSKSNRILINNPGEYIVRITNLGGCTNQQSINIVQNEVPEKPIISQDTQGYLLSNYSYGNTWFKDGVTLSDTTQRIEPIGIGSYTVMISQNGCASQLSSPFLLTSINHLEYGKYLKFYPNPTEDNIKISHNLSASTSVVLSIFDNNGKILIEKVNVLNGEQISLMGLQRGFYLIRLYSSDGKNTVVSKILKN